MPTNYPAHYGATKKTQREPLPGREADMVKNPEGGYVFKLDPWQQLQRFLILGTEGGSFYANEAKLSTEAGTQIVTLVKLDGKRVVDAIVDVSVNGRAYKQDPTLYALALAYTHGDDVTRALINTNFNRVVRIGTHLFTFVTYVTSMRGWSGNLRGMIAGWYTSKTAEQLSYQVTKYKQRNGMSHRDVLRMAHPKAPSKAHEAVFRWITAGPEELGVRTVERKHGDEMVVTKYPSVKQNLPVHLKSIRRVQAATDVSEVVKEVTAHNLPREVIPTEMLNELKMWDALLDNMPITAMIRNLGKMTSIGLLKPLSGRGKHVADALTNPELIKKGRVHPMQILAAMMTYSSGHGARGSLSWSPDAKVVQALDKAFYLSFDNIEPANKRTLVALDVSSSMSWNDLCGIPGLTPRVASAAMAMAMIRTEPETHVLAFSHDLIPVAINSKSTLNEAISAVSNLRFGGTNCALPMEWAIREGIDVETFAILTDSETYSRSSSQPSVVLDEYRKTSGNAARLGVIAMEYSGRSIADPADAGMMDFVGFSTDTPLIFNAFSRGDI